MAENLSEFCTKRKNKEKGGGAGIFETHQWNRKHFRIQIEPVSNAA